MSYSSSSVLLVPLLNSMHMPVFWHNMAIRQSVYLLILQGTYLELQNVFFLLISWKYALVKP